MRQHQCSAKCGASEVSVIIEALSDQLYTCGRDRSHVQERAQGSRHGTRNYIVVVIISRLVYHF